MAFDLRSHIRVDDRSATSPVILHVPHSSRVMPPALLSSFIVPPGEIAAELDAMTDIATDRIADGAPAASRMQHGLSRLLVDVERFPDDTEEMNAVGMGMLYTHGSRGQEMRRVSVDDARVLRDYFDAYAAAFTNLVERTLAVHGRAVIVDVHSYPLQPHLYELHAEERRPELCMGTDPLNTAPALRAAVRQAFSHLEVIENEPFHGCYVPLRYFQRDARVQSVMLEIRRDLYVREATLNLVETGLARLASALMQLVDQIQAGPI